MTERRVGEFRNKPYMREVEMGIAKIEVSKELLASLLHLPNDIEIEGTYETKPGDPIFILIKGDSLPPCDGRQTVTIEATKTIIESKIRYLGAKD